MGPLVQLDPTENASMGRQLSAIAANFASLANAFAFGNSWYVNETTGNDGYPGTSPAQPFKTLTAALAAATAANGDVIFLEGTVHLTATLNWNKNNVSLVGINGPSNNCRARISAADTLTSTQATALAPLVNVTAVGCSFINIGTFLAYAGETPATAAVCWAEAGGRNYYNHVQFFGGGDAATAALAGMRSLTIASDENEFQNCVIGLDTIQRTTAANMSLEFLSGSAARNIFRKCTFPCWSSIGTNGWVKFNANSGESYTLFEDCAFLNAVDWGPGTALAAGFFTPSTMNGAVLLKNCTTVGATAVSTTGPLYSASNAAIGATTSDIASKLT